MFAVILKGNALITHHITIKKRQGLARTMLISSCSEINISRNFFKTLPCVNIQPNKV